MAEITSRGRRALLTGSGAIAAAAAGAQLGPSAAEALEPLANNPNSNRFQKASVLGSANTIEPRFAIVALNRLGFGPRRAGLGPIPNDDPNLLFKAGFETPVGNGLATLDDVSYFLSLGDSDGERLGAYVDEQLDPNLDDSFASGLLAAYASEFDTLDDPITQLFNERECAAGSVYREAQIQVENATWTRATFSRRQLFELTVDFWHNHFNVFGAVEGDNDILAVWPSWDRDVIRAHAFGNFHDMVMASAKHAAMLEYLDNVVNTVAGFNENYARELYELHTLGAENYLGTASPDTVPILAENPYVGLGDPILNQSGLPSAPLGIAEKYVDADVYAAARCLTGWRFNDNDTRGVQPPACGFGVFDPNGDTDVHDPGAKAVLSRNVNVIPNDGDVTFDGEVAIKAAVYHPGTAKHIARKLCRRLIADDPPESVVEAAAATFYAARRAPDQIAQTIRTIVLSPEFRDPALFQSKIKRPFEYVVSALRALGGGHVFRTNDPDGMSDRMLDEFRKTTQRLFAWRTPDGYPDYRSHWEGASSLVNCWRTIDFAIDYNASRNDSSRPPIINVLEITIDALGESPTPRVLVEFWCNRLLGFSPNGGWTGGTGTAIDTAPTAVGAEALRFITQTYFQNGETPDVTSDVGINPDVPISADLDGNSSSTRWRYRVRGMVSVILWSPQFMQR